MTPTQMTRQRFKAMRTGKPFDPPSVHADKLTAQLLTEAKSDPAPESRAYRQYVEASFSDRFLELCGRYPARRRS